MEKLYCDNRGLLWHWARRYAGLCENRADMDVDDLVQAGFIGLVEAKKTHDPQQGSWGVWASFYIRNRMLDALGIRGRKWYYFVTLPDGTLEKRRFRVASLDAPAYGDDDPTALMETLADESVPAVDETLIADDEARIVREAVAALKDEDMRHAVSEYYLQGRTYKSIAEETGVTPNAIRIRCNNALRRLRQARSIRMLMLDQETRFSAHKGVTAFWNSRSSVVEDAVIWREQRLSNWHQYNAGA